MANHLHCPRRTRQHAVDQGCGSKRLAVYQRLHNSSAFNGYRRTPSAWSGVRCLDCGKCWRTRASVAHLPDYREGMA